MIPAPNLAQTPGLDPGPAAAVGPGLSRPTWSGLLRLSLVAVPVRAYPAVSQASVPHFHWLHAGCGQRISYHKHCPVHGPVQHEEIVRGYPHAGNHHVVVEPEELDRLRPVRDRALVLEQFVPLQDVDPVYFAGRSLYLFPDSPAAGHPYSVLATALAQSGKAALGRVVFTTQRHLVLVRPAAGRLLAVDVLHYPAQVRSAAAAWAEELPEPSPAELDLAAQLLALASAPLDWSRYQDTTALELAALVEAKRAEQPPPADEPVAVVNLMQALKESLAVGSKSRLTLQSTRRSRSRRRAGLA